MPERDLNPLSCSVLRCLVDLTMYVKYLIHGDQVGRVITRDTPPGGPPTRDFIETQLNLDIDQICKCSNRSRDDTITLLHQVIERISTAANRTQPTVLSTIQQRKQWESQFINRYVTPTFSTDGAERAINNAQVGLADTNKTHIDSILNPNITEISQPDVLTTAGLWLYQTPLTINVIRTRHDDSIKAQAPFLRKLIAHHEALQAVRYLSDVVKLVNLLSSRFHCTYSRTDAADLTISAFVADVGDAELESLIDSYIAAWNILVSQVAGEDTAGLRTMAKNSPLSYLLFDQHAARDDQMSRSVLTLIDYLITINNTLAEDRPSVTLGAVSTSNVVCFKSRDELLNLITSHSEYELSDKRKMTSDWMAIEEDAKCRYLYNKCKVKMTKEHMPYFLFKEDLNLHRQMEALKSKQTRLPEADQRVISDRLNRRLPALSLSLKDLQIVINFLSAHTDIQTEEPLMQYMKSTLGREPHYLTNSVKLKHVISVWLVVKYEQADQLMINRQNAFDDVPAECCKILSEELKSRIDECANAGSPRTFRLMKLLFEMITVNLNKSTAMQDIGQLILKPLQAELDSYVYGVFEDDDLYEVLDALPKVDSSVKVEHAVTAWRYIWTRYTTTQATGALA